MHTAFWQVFNAFRHNFFLSDYLDWGWSEMKGRWEHSTFMLNKEDPKVEVADWVIIIRVLTTENIHDISDYILTNNVKQYSPVMRRTHERHVWICCWIWLLEYIKELVHLFTLISFQTHKTYVHLQNRNKDIYLKKKKILWIWKDMRVSKLQFQKEVRKNFCY